MSNEFKIKHGLIVNGDSNTKSISKQVYNTSGGTLAQFKIVKATGVNTSNNIPTIDIVSNATNDQPLGILDLAVNNNTIGKVLHSGLLVCTGFDTTGASLNDTVYSSDIGDLTLSETDCIVGQVLTLNTNGTVLFNFSSQASRSLGSGNIYKVNQTAHGLSVLDSIYFKDDTDFWEKAQANNSDTLGTHVVLSVEDANNFTYTQIGRHEISSHGLTIGQYYFTSVSVPGTLSSTSPETGFNNPMIFVESADIIHVLNYRPLSVSAENSFSLSFEVTQTSHSFAVLDSIYFKDDTDNWQKAQADNKETLGTHIVISVEDVDNFTAAQVGRHSVSAHGLTIGEYYYTSNATAGQITSTEPTSGYSNPLVFVETVDLIHVLPYRPSAIAGSGGVSKAGTPVDNQVAVWSDDGVIEGTNNFVFDGTNVGIGTNTPTVILDIHETDDTNAVVYISTDGDTKDSIIWMAADRNGASKWVGIGVDGSEDVLKLTNDNNFDTTHLVIDNGGNVGIGTISPDAPLEVEGKILATNGVIEAQDDTYSYLTSSSYSSDSGIYPLVTLKKSGSDTIGTNAETVNGSHLGFIGFQGVNSNNSIANAGYISMIQTGAAGTAEIPGDMLFYTATASATPIERMRINSTGKVGIGTNTPATKLQVHESVNSSLAISATNFNAGASAHVQNYIQTNAGVLVTQMGSTANGGAGYFYYSGTSSMNIYTTGATSLNLGTNSVAGRITITSAGNVGVKRVPTTNALEVDGNASKTTSGDWLANSDRRIKKNINPITDALDTINKLNPVTFQYTDDYQSKHEVGDKTYYNYIAQEYQTVFPDSVQGSGEILDDIEILQMESGSAQVVAIKAIQELSILVKQLQQEIIELKKSK